MLGTVAQIAASLGGRLHGEGRGEVSGASIDTRSLRPAEIFFAIVAERDGHDFVHDAARAGAAALVVSRRPEPEPPVPWIEVGDTLAALQALGSHSRARSRARVVGLTGSCGKTTTKELVAACLGRGGTVLATTGNLNNHLGVPLTLSGLGSDHDFAVIEMGANHHGEIELLTGLADPDVGLVTCVAPAHTEHFGDIDGVARAKGELFACMRADAVAVVNLDDPRVRAMERTPSAVVSYGSRASTSPDVLLEEVRETDAGQEIVLRCGDEPVSARLALRGRHNALNAAAALAAAWAAGLDPGVAARGLPSVRPVAGRGATRRGRRVDVIDDTYNANPASMEAGLSILASAAAGRRTVAVLGDMYELGPEAAGLHEQVGGCAARSGVHLLVAVGKHAGRMRAGAVGSGLPPTSVICLESTEAVLEGGALGSVLREGDVVLVKGSRGMKMERIVESLIYW